VLRRVLSAIGDLSKKHATIMFSENGKTIAACGIAERADQGICIKRPSLTAVARGQDGMTTLRPVGRDQQSAVVFIKSHIFAEGFAPTKGASNEDLVVTFENAN
jgi:hypothetical protein